MDMLFEKRGAFVQESLARLRKVTQTYRGKQREKEFEKVLTEFSERYERLEDNCGDWMRAAMEGTDKLRAAWEKSKTQEATIETLRTELAIAHDRLATIAEHYDELHESDIPALGFLNLKEKA